MTTPTGDLVCRLVYAVTGRAPREIELIADADPRKGWLVRVWLDDSSLRDYRLPPADVVPGRAEGELPGRLIESRFDRWPPAEIRGGIQRCRC